MLLHDPFSTPHPLALLSSPFPVTVNDKVTLSKAILLRTLELVSFEVSLGIRLQSDGGFGWIRQNRVTVNAVPVHGYLRNDVG